ncbi:COG1470 family protein [Streptomyces sp. 8N616]|uniref:COG1470 family protein n=1 Tax=Streptomyces sp. 8N616 TaxID=3457414 RepID=UPI003FD3A573
MTSRTRRGAVVLAAALAAAAAVLVSATAYGVPAADAGWSAAPAPGGGSRPSAGGRAYFYLEGRPGSVLEDTVAVTNPGDRPRTVELRGADAYNTHAGAFAVRETGRSTGVGAWVALASTQVKVPPRTRAEVPFTVTVPPDAVPGDHPGAVVVTGGGRESGVRIHLRVTGPTLSALSVEDVSVAETGSGAEIHYALVNRGNTALSPRIAVRADGLFGDEVLQRDARALPMELLPGQRVRLTEKWPGAPWLDSVQVALTATAAGGAHGSATASYTAFPWAAAGFLLLGGGLAAAAAGGTYVRRRRRRASRASGAEQAGAGDGDGADDGGHEAGCERTLADTGSGAAR